MTKTLKERYQAGLEARGWAVDKSAASRKFVTMTKADTLKKVYIGKAGAVRIGCTVSASLPISGRAKAALLEPYVPAVKPVQSLTHYSVTSAGSRFKLQAFPTGRTSSTVESNETWPTREEAQSWAERANRGLLAGLTFAMYADD